MTDRMAGRVRGLVGGAMLAAAVAGLLGLLVSTGAAGGQVDVYEFPNPDLEARYRALIDEFRCPKCLNTNLAGSDAPIAADLRKTVHRLLVQEAFEDQQIRDFLQARYGDFVLYDPPFKPGTWALWLLPVVFIAIGVWALARVVRPAERTVLSAEEQAKIESILRGTGD
ncbi:MAG: cytochrome c-type biogenesis protein [Pseudomonadales bacterium]